MSIFSTLDITGISFVLPPKPTELPPTPPTTTVTTATEGNLVQAAILSTVQGHSHAGVVWVVL